MGIVLAITLFCGGSFFGLLILISLVPTNPDSDLRNLEADNRKPESGINYSKHKITLKDDLSEWEFKIDGGEAYYSQQKLFVKSDKPNFYFVVVTSDSKFRTENAYVKVTVQDLSGDAKAKGLGYGVLIHCGPKAPLKQGYAFLINAQFQMFRIARHVDKEETSVVEWTYFPAIKKGDTENVLEVVDENRKMSFYINGKFASSYQDSDGIKTGVVGLYSGDAAVAAFSNLELRR